MSSDVSSEESEEDGIWREDLVIVTNVRRRFHGKLCYVQYAENDKLEVKVLLSVNFKEEYPGVSIDVSNLKKLDHLEVRMSDVQRFPLSALLRCPPKPSSLSDLIERDWCKHSTQRFSPLRTRGVWESLSEEQRSEYLKPVQDEEATYKRLAVRRKESWQLVQQLLDVMPKQRKLSSYMIFCQESGFWNPAARWRALTPTEKQSFANKSAALTRQVQSELSVFVEVAVGGGWSEQRAVFFPKSFNICLKHLLLCQGRKGCSASRISATLWKQQIFPFLPFHWFLSPLRPLEIANQEVQSKPEIIPAKLRRRLRRPEFGTDSE